MKLISVSYTHLPPWYAYLRIAEGCDNCCAYCVIPRLRGRYRSRPMNELLDEASELASAGVKELNSFVFLRGIQHFRIRFNAFGETKGFSYGQCNIFY